MNSQKNQGKIETVFKILNKTVDPVNFLNILKNNSKNYFLLESADIVEKYGDKSIGCVDPCLRISVKDSKFIILALNPIGEKFILSIKEDFFFADNLKINEKSISGEIKKRDGFLDEESRLKEKDVFELLRIILFRYKPKIELPIPFCGLFGMISYDAIDYVEKLPKQNQSEDEMPDIIFYYANNLFVMDHINNKTYLISNYFVDGGITNSDSILSNYHYDCNETIKKYELLFNSVKDYQIRAVAEKNENKNEIILTSSDDTFIDSIKKIKEHIKNGDLFQCVLSRSYITKIIEAPLDIYARLKNLNPGPYMFYFHNEDNILLGSSPETCLKVSGDNNHKIVEIKPIAGTLPRGMKNGSLNPELDSRFELQLLLDEKELAEHCMLVDLARNDIARISKPNTRITSKLLNIEKFSHVQHLVSSVRGELRSDLDALHAYKATMNMGTLTGAPKIKAMELIRKYEKDKRGYYGGAVCYLTPRGDFDSCIVIRAITIKNKIANVRSGAGIVFDSDPNKELEETKKKSAACLAALGVEL